MFRLASNLELIDQEANKLLRIHSHLSVLPPRFAKLVAEIIILRVFDLLENSFKSITIKLQCGALYFDGTSANVTVAARSADGAIKNMINYGRTKPRYQLRWSSVSEIKRNLEFVLQPTDHALQILDYNSTFIDEFRRVRNRVAHNNVKSRKEFQIIVRRYYGATLNFVTPGTLLLTDRWHPQILVKYIQGTKILVKELVKGRTS